MYVYIFIYIDSFIYTFFLRFIFDKAVLPTFVLFFGC